jgi:hypothetical protein
MVSQCFLAVEHHVVLYKDHCLIVCICHDDIKGSVGALTSQLVSHGLGVELSLTDTQCSVAWFICSALCEWYSMQATADHAHWYCVAFIVLPCVAVHL